jgi:ribosomal protein L7/L12
MIDCPHCRQQIPETDQSCPHCGAWLADGARTASTEVERKIRELLQLGQKIEAIKLYREHTGDNLADAKTAIEVFESMPPDDDLERTVLDFMRKNEKIAAIKIVREQTQCGLKEAKDFVEKLATLHGIPQSKGVGCFAVLLGLLACLAAISFLSQAIF